MILIRKKIHLLGLLLVLYSSHALSMETISEGENVIKTEVDSNKDPEENMIKKKANRYKKEEEEKVNLKLKKQNDKIAKLTTEQDSDRTALKQKLTEIDSNFRIINNMLGLEKGAVIKDEYNKAPERLYYNNDIYLKKQLKNGKIRYELERSDKRNNYSSPFLVFGNIKSPDYTNALECHSLIEAMKTNEASKNKYEFFLKACNYTYTTIGLVTMGCLSFAYKKSLLNTASIPKDTKCLVTAGVVGTAFVGSVVASQFYLPKKIDAFNKKTAEKREELNAVYRKKYDTEF